MDKIIFPEWFYELLPEVQHCLQYGPQQPFRYIEYICHLSPDEIREAATNPDLRGMLVYADLSNEEEVEQQLLNLIRCAAWERETMRKSTLPEELNNYKFIRHYGNKAVVVHWTYDKKMIHQSIAEFKNSHIDGFILGSNHKTGKWERLPLADAWLKDPKTPRFEYIEFMPGIDPKDQPEQILNSWQGWPCRTDITDDNSAEPIGCELFLQHIRKNLCGDDGNIYFYLLGWMADALINTHRTSEVAVVLRGPQGSGKTLWAKLFMELFAPHHLTLDKPEQVTGGFNKHLQDKCMIFADEAFFAGHKQHAATLKTLITSDEIFIEPKGVDGFMAKKLFRMIIASNDEHVIRAEVDDRRYLVLDVDAREQNQDPEYFGAIVNEWNSGGKQALFRWLRGEYWKDVLELKVWDVRDRPKTKALQKQKDLSLPLTQSIIQQMLHDGELPDLYSYDCQSDTVFVATRLLAETRKLSPKDETALGYSIRILAGKNAQNKRVYMEGDYMKKQYRGFWLPSLDICRERWQKHLERDIDWPDDISTWEIEPS